MTHATHILHNAAGTYALAEVESTTDANGGPAIQAKFAPLVTARGGVMDYGWAVPVGLFSIDSLTTIIPIRR